MSGADDGPQRGGEDADISLVRPYLLTSGRAHPVEVRYLGRRPEQRVEGAVAAAVRAVRRVIRKADSRKRQGSPLSNQPRNDPATSIRKFKILGLGVLR